MDHSKMDHSQMDHSKMDHSMMISSEESMEDDHMGMAHMGGMMMQMYFTASSRVTILFEGWATKDAGQLFGSMVCNSYSRTTFFFLLRISENWTLLNLEEARISSRICQKNNAIFES